MPDSLEDATLPGAPLQGVLDLLDEDFGVDTVWLFGSEAAGRARGDSDVDLAALFRRRPSPLERMDLRSEAEEILGRPVDLVDLEDASPLLAFQVLRHGRLLVDRNPSRRHRFTAGVPGRREDVLIMRRAIEERILQRLREGKAHGRA